MQSPEADDCPVLTLNFSKIRLRHICLLHPPELVVVPEVEAEHVVKVLTAQLSLGVQGDVAGLIDGVPLHPLLALDAVEAGDLSVPANQGQNFVCINNKTGKDQLYLLVQVDCSK